MSGFGNFVNELGIGIRFLCFVYDLWAMSILIPLPISLGVFDGLRNTHRDMYLFVNEVKLFVDWLYCTQVVRKLTIEPGVQARWIIVI